MNRDEWITIFMNTTGCTYEQADELMQEASKTGVSCETIQKALLLGYNYTSVYDIITDQTHPSIIYTIVKYRIRPRK